MDQQSEKYFGMTNDSSGDENDGRVLTEADIKRMRKQGDVEGLINALTYKRKTKIRFDAARALGEMGDLRAVEPLMEAVKDENRDVRWAAARALGELKDLRAVEPLIQALKDEGSDVRKAAIWALGELGDVGAVELLIEVLRNDIWGLRLEAARALAKIGDARAIEPLREFLEGEYDIVVQEALWDLENRKREEEN